MAHYLITGGTGYIGSRMVKLLLDEKTAQNQVTAVVRDLDKAEEMYTEAERKRIVFIKGDLTDADRIRQIQDSYDYLIHCAAVTKSIEMVTHPTKVIASILDGTRNILELAERCQVKSVVYLSSMEIYGKIDCSGETRIQEEALGEVDLLQVRSCYPEAKRMAENLCFCFYSEYGVPVKIARLAQTFGKGILPGENRVFAQFARAAKEGKDIILHTEGNSVGNYCDIQDALNGILLILQKGENGQAYNVVNEETTMTIRQMAQLVAEEAAEGKIQVRYEIPEENIYGYGAQTGLRLSSRKLRELGWKPAKGLKEMFQDAMESL